MGYDSNKTVQKTKENIADVTVRASRVGCQTGERRLGSWCVKGKCRRLRQTQMATYPAQKSYNRDSREPLNSTKKMYTWPHGMGIIDSALKIQHWHGGLGK